MGKSGMSADQSTVGWGGIVDCVAGHRFAPKLDRFIFLRHGQTDGNAAGIYQPADLPLNAKGEAQARAAGELLGSHKIGRIVASPMPRAWKTANTIASHHGVEPEVEVALQERIFLRLWGSRIGVLDWSKDPAGCERLSAFVGRVANAFERVLVEPPKGAPQGHDLLVVAHGGVLLVLTALIGLDGANIPRGNAIALRVERAGGSWKMNPV